LEERERELYKYLVRSEQLNVSIIQVQEHRTDNPGFSDREDAIVQKCMTMLTSSQSFSTD
jgi:hypothetical protein